MVKVANKHLILVFAIFVFAFLYRFLLLTRGTFPPGADIGLHNSVVYSILNQEYRVNFFYNYYQMGGGLSLTFPGYHLFVAQTMLLTGLPDYLVHAIVGSFFSSVMVLVSYLITRVVWRESVAVVVAFLVAVSRFDVEMLLWGGFPNVVALLLIPVVFYFFVQKVRFSGFSFYVSVSLLVGSVFLVHSLSSVVFVCVLFFVVLFGLVFGSRVGFVRREVLCWLLPVIFGGLIASPYLFPIIPAYFTNTSNVEIIQATAATLILPLEIILPIFAVAGFYFIWSKKYHNHYFTVPTVLLVFWMIIPTLFTQSYLVGLYTDFHRFLYFTSFPIICLIGLFIDFGSKLFAHLIDTYRTLINQLNNTQTKNTEQIPHKHLTTPHLKKIISKNLPPSKLYAGFLISFLLICLFSTPLFLSPREGFVHQTFYQIMNEPLYQSMNWIKTNTPKQATFVTEAYYGWWLSGFAQRATWSAEEPQFLLLSREVPIAQTATRLLDTNYQFESSFKLSNETHNIQIKEDGGYMARHNPQILTCLNSTYSPYPFFNFNNHQTKISYTINNIPHSTTLDKLTLINMHMENNTQHTTTSITKGNEHFTYTQLTTVNTGSKLVNITTLLKTTTNNISLTNLETTLEVNATPIGTERPNTLGFLAKNVKAFGQIIFNKNTPTTTTKPYNSIYTEVDLNYKLENNTQTQIQITLTTYSTTNNQTLYNNKADNQILLNNFFDNQIDLNLKPENRAELPLPTPFNYQTELKTNNIDYIAITRAYEAYANADIKHKFANDPLFNLVFINPEVAIFQVKK
ncbi:MAG: hypothetical protein FWD52_05090 [Candidatus Bathyarchaeota archaeon]|nr:hypothetical protein [Candidatus Termiticorpusculum sp.]